MSAKLFITDKGALINWNSNQTVIVTARPAITFHNTNQPYLIIIQTSIISKITTNHNINRQNYINQPKKEKKNMINRPQSIILFMCAVCKSGLAARNIDKRKNTFRRAPIGHTKLNYK